MLTIRWEPGRAIFAHPHEPVAATDLRDGDYVLVTGTGRIHGDDVTVADHPCMVASPAKAFDDWVKVWPYETDPSPFTKDQEDEGKFYLPPTATFRRILISHEVDSSVT